MRSIISVFVCIIFAATLNAQLSTAKVSGGSVTTKLELGASINPGSSLSREWIIVNDKRCPAELNNKVGIQSKFVNAEYRFVPVGSFIPSETIVAFEIHHVLYGIFGEHIRTIRNLKVMDTSSQLEMNGWEGWPAEKVQLEEYLTCVSFVAVIKTAKGDIWKYDPLEIKEELRKAGVQYEQSYAPFNSSNDLKN